MNFLTILGTARENRKSIGPAKAVLNQFEEKGHTSKLFDLKEKEIPPLGNRTYVEDESPVPEDIQEFSRLVKEADGIIIVTPEYNHSIPGILKTTLDYLYPEYREKAFMYVTVSGGSFGGVRAISHLHDITLEFKARPGPEMPVSNVSKSFSKTGEILDGSYKDRLNDFVDNSVDFAKNK